MPAFQPQPNWDSYDFYRAHAANPDRAFYNSIFSRIKEYALTGGAGLHEARVWHRRVYSGLTDLRSVSPADLGLAAAYEAYRMWRHYHSTLFAPLGGERERERECLIALGTAEASRLWQASGRYTDAYDYREAMESAGVTAARIAHKVLGDSSYRSFSSSSRRSSFSSDYGNDYDDRSHSHHRRRSSSGGYPEYLGNSPSLVSVTPGYAQSPIPIARTASPYGGVINASPYGQPGLMPHSGYATQYATPQYQVAAPAYASPYGTPFPTQGGLVPGGVAPGSTVIIERPRRRSRHSSSTSRHHHHHRSHSRGRDDWY